MKCHIVQKKLSAYQDRELELREQEQVTSHLLSCRTCREQYAELERVWQTLGELPEVQADPFFYQRLTKKMEEPPKRLFLPVFEGFFQRLRVPVYASILFIGILVGTYLGNFLTRDGLFRTNHVSHPEEMTDFISLRAFDPLAPGTLGDGYVRMVSYTGKEPR
jgi:anti-sigma factor RsiW